MREHDWVEVSDNGVREDRRCKLCGVPDNRIRKSPWQVTTPCIEPVPDKVSYQALIAEIKVQLPQEYAHKQLIGRIVCHGVPGNWQVGFSTYMSTYPHQKDGFRELEHGFASVLRYLRARQFDPYKYSDLSYQERLGRPSDHDFDD